MNTEQEVVKIMRETSDKIKVKDDELASIDYVDKGLFDSFQIIELIAKLEAAFKIRFSSDDITSKEFRTAEGITKVIERHVKRK